MTVLWTQPAKGIYLANRNPTLTREEFAQRWARHGRIGEVIGDPRLESAVSSVRYCLTVDPTSILACATDEHDGVALLALRNLLAIPTYHGLLTGNEIAYADELRTFARPVEDCSLYTASELLVEGPETDVVVLELARRRNGLDAFAYLRQSDEGHQRALATAGLVEHGLRRWVRNVPVAPAARGFGYDDLNELWFDSIDAVRAASDALEWFFEEKASFTERGASLVMVATVIVRVGRDRP